MSTFQSTFDIGSVSVKVEFAGVSRVGNLKFQTFLVYRDEDPVFLREILISAKKYNDRFRSTVLHDIKGIAGLFQHYVERGVESELAVLLAQAGKYHRLVFNRLVWSQHFGLGVDSKSLIGADDYGSWFCERLLTWVSSDQTDAGWTIKLLPPAIEPAEFNLSSPDGPGTLKIQFKNGSVEGVYNVAAGKVASCDGYSGTWVEQAQYLHWILIEIKRRLDEEK